VRLDF